MSTHRNAQQGRTGIDKILDNLDISALRSGAWQLAREIDPPLDSQLVDGIVALVINFWQVELKSALKKDILGLVPEKHQALKGVSAGYNKGYNQAIDEITTKIRGYFE